MLKKTTLEIFKFFHNSKYKLIGIGGKSLVYKIRNKAFKIYSEDELTEIEIYKRLGINKNIPIFYKYGIMGNYKYIEIEYIQGFTLWQLIRYNWQIKKNVDEIFIKAFLCQSSNVLSFAHSKNIIYRDIKPDNFLINRDGVVKLIDFEVSLVVDSEPIEIEGTNGEYQAPEQVKIVGETIDNESNLTDYIVKNYTYKKSDIWSLGILTLHLLNKETYLRTSNDIIKDINEKEILIEGCSNELKQILNSMIKRDVKKRISSDELKNRMEKIISYDDSKIILKDYVNKLWYNKEFKTYLNKIVKSI